MDGDQEPLGLVRAAYFSDKNGPSLHQQGMACPLCGNREIYNRHINRGMAISLGRMLRWTLAQGWKEGELPWMHIPTVCGGKSREEHKLTLWGLIEEEKILRPDGGRAGWWRLTIKGVEFTMGLRKVSYTAVTGPKNTLIRLEGKPWSIDDAYREPFDLRNI